MNDEQPAPPAAIPAVLFRGLTVRRILTAAAFALLMALTYAPLAGVGFTDHDSMDTALHVWKGPRAYFDWVWQLAVYHGRWHYLYSYLFAAAPFLLASFAYYKTVVYSSLAMNALLFYCVVRETTRSREFAGLTLAAFLISLQITTNHCLLTGYFVSFHVCAAFVMLSFLLLVRYCRAGGAPRLWGSAAFFALALPFHETVLLYLALLGLTVLAHGRAYNWGLGRITKTLLPHAAWAAAFVVSSMVFRRMHPSEYVGNDFQWARFSLSAYVQTWITYTMSAYPGYFTLADAEYAKLFDHFQHGLHTQAGTWTTLLVNMRPAWVLRAALTFGLAVVLLFRCESLTRKRFPLIAGAGLALLLIPHGVISLSRHYENLALKGERVSTHMSYLCAFGVALLLALALAVIVRATPLRRSAWTRGFTCACAGLMAAAISLCTSYSNHFVALSQRAQTQKWQLMNKFLASPTFDAIPEEACLIAPSLWEPSFNVYYSLKDFSGSHLIPATADTPNYWEAYCTVKTGKHLDIAGDRKELEALLDNADLPRRAGLLTYQENPNTFSAHLVVIPPRADANTPGGATVVFRSYFGDACAAGRVD